MDLDTQHLLQQCREDRRNWGAFYQASAQLDHIFREQDTVVVLPEKYWSRLPSEGYGYLGEYRQIEHWHWEPDPSGEDWPVPSDLYLRDGLIDFARIRPYGNAFRVTPTDLALWLQRTQGEGRMFEFTFRTGYAGWHDVRDTSPFHAFLTLGECEASLISVRPIRTRRRQGASM